MSDAERAGERRFMLRLLLITVTGQLAAGALTLSVLLTRHHHVGGAPPMPTLPAYRGAIDARSQ